MDDWKMQQGNLGPEPDDVNDDMAMYVLYSKLIPLNIKFRQHNINN